MLGLDLALHIGITDLIGISVHPITIRYAIMDDSRVVSCNSI